MRRFLIGLATGALLMHIYLQYGGQWFHSAWDWMSTAASGYRGDSHQKRAQEALH